MTITGIVVRMIAVHGHAVAFERAQSRSAKWLDTDKVAPAFTPLYRGWFWGTVAKTIKNNADQQAMMMALLSPDRSLSSIPLA